MSLLRNDKSYKTSELKSVCEVRNCKKQKLWTQQKIQLVAELLAPQQQLLWNNKKQVNLEIVNSEIVHSKLVFL